MIYDLCRRCTKWFSNFPIHHSTITNIRNMLEPHGGMFQHYISTSPPSPSINFIIIKNKERNQ